MSFRNLFRSWVNAGMPDGFEEETSGTTGETAGNLATPEEPLGTHRPTAPLLAQIQAAPARLAARSTEEDDELARLRAENDRFRAERQASLHAQAVAFAQAQAKEGKIDTAEVDFYAFLYEQLSLMDQSDKLPEGTTVGKASVSSRAVALEQSLSARAPIAPRREQVVTDPLPDGLRVVSNGSAGTDEERTFYEAGKKHAEKQNRRA